MKRQNLWKLIDQNVQYRRLVVFQQVWYRKPDIQITNIFDGYNVPFVHEIWFFERMIVPNEQLSAFVFDSRETLYHDFFKLVEAFCNSTLS